MTPPGQQPGWYPDPTDEPALRWWDGGTWAAPTRQPDRRPVSARARVVARLWPAVTAAGGAGLVVGAFLPWTILTGTYGARLSVAGTDTGTRGWTAALLGLLLVVAGLASLSRPRRPATVVADVGALAAAGVTCLQLLHLATGTGVLGPSNSSGIWDVGLGTGLTTAAVAALAALIGAAGITGRDARAQRPR